VNELLKNIKVDSEGFLKDHNEWSEEIAKTLAEQEGIYELTKRHFEIIYIIRDEYSLKGQAPSLRRLSKVHGFPTKELYQLFPGGPGKKAAKISGVKKPRGCI